MPSRRRRFLSLLAPATGLIMIAVVGLAPEARSDTVVNGPFAQGTGTPDTDRGHTVEWTIQADNLCGVSGGWSTFTANSTGLSDITTDPQFGVGPAVTKVTATISGAVGSTAELVFSFNFIGFTLDPISGVPVPCNQGTTVNDPFIVTGTPPEATPTTASLNYKRALPGFTGKLTADEDCDSDRKVQLFKQDAGPDTKIDTKTSAGDGSYKFKGKAKNGTYYVKAPKDDRGSVICGLGKSSNVKVG